MGILKSISKYGLIAPVVLGNFATKVLEKATGEKYGRTTINEAANTKTGQALGVAIVGTAAAASAIAAGVGGSASALKNLIPKSTVGKAAAVFTVGAAAASPAIAEAVIDAPFRIAAAGKKVGESYEGLPKEVKEKVGDYGAIVLEAAGIGGLLYTGEQAAEAAGIRGGAGFIGANPNKDVPVGANPNKDVPVGVNTTALGAVGGQPLPMEVQELGSPSSGNRRKRRSKAQGQTIKQSVRINIMNSNKYIKRGIYV